MGKGKKSKSGTSAQLGRALIKDRFGSNRGRKMVSDNSMLHTTEIKDGYDWGRLNLQSVTEESSFQEFLSTAELAGTEFQAEKLNIKFVNPRSNVGLLTGDEKTKMEDTHKQFRDMLKIPRRPPWDTSTSPSELDQNEKEHFLEWRRTLATLQEDHGILLTPYEKNLEFWRQLWRVVERSDVIVQIVDARNPLLFRCEDLEKYVKEVSADKMNLILINKADFLNESQRKYWAEYFGLIGIKVVFFSAMLASESETNKIDEEADDQSEDVDIKTVKKDVESLEKAVEHSENVLNHLLTQIETIIDQTNLLSDKTDSEIQNSSDILTREELTDYFKVIHTGPKVTKNVTTIGLVGYPNVGKSSTINTLLASKKVSVSATPGKTKHFQTLFLDKDLLLCDCPGLVMPSFVFTKAEMILNGILPIDQMRDHVPPTNLVTSLIPRHVIEEKYGIMLPKPIEGEDQERGPTAEELLNAYAFNRGFMTANGQPDNPRAARYVLKDYMNGKLLYCQAPPNVDQKDYYIWPEKQEKPLENRVVPPRQARAVRSYHLTTEDLDKAFFHQKTQGVHAKGVAGKSAGLPSTSQSSETGSSEMIAKPWKKINKHENKKKKEKLRRVYAHLDQH